jgi:hypothetical protein
VVVDNSFPPSAGKKKLNRYRNFADWRNRLENGQKMTLSSVDLLIADEYRGGIGYCFFNAALTMNDKPLSSHVLLKGHTVAVLIILRCDEQVFNSMGWVWRVYCHCIQ